MSVHLGILNIISFAIPFEIRVSIFQHFVMNGMASSSTRGKNKFDNSLSFSNDHYAKYKPTGETHPTLLLTYQSATDHRQFKQHLYDSTSSARTTYTNQRTPVTPPVKPFLDIISSL